MTSILPERREIGTNIPILAMLSFRAPVRLRDAERMRETARRPLTYTSLMLLRRMQDNCLFGHTLTRSARRRVDLVGNSTGALGRRFRPLDHPGTRNLRPAVDDADLCDRLFVGRRGERPHRLAVPGPRSVTQDPIA